MIRDADGREMTMWPAGAVVSGEDGPVLVIGVDTPAGGGLTTEDDPGLRVMARLAGSGDDFQDLASSPFPLEALPAGVTQFEVFLRAAPDVAGVEHFDLTVAPVVSGPANWAG